MNGLPTELIDIIVHNFSRADIKSLRQTSKHLSGPLTKHLFSHIYVSNQHASQVKYNSILSSPILSEAVTHVSFYDEDSFYVKYGCIRGRKRHIQALKTTISTAPNFPNIHIVSLAFSPDTNRMSVVTSNYDEIMIIHHEILTTLFDALQRITNLRSLSLQNLRSIYNQNLPSAFRCVLGRLKELRLEVPTALPELDSVEWEGVATMLSQMPSSYLTHAPTLASLTLHFSEYWGYILGSDFREIHFPALKKLEMNNYIISHDWQLSWILQHGATLEQLVLNDTVILSFVYDLLAPEDEDNNNAIRLTLEADTTHYWTYSRRWSWFFTQCESKMPRLRRFTFGEDERECWDDVMDWEKYKAFNGESESSPFCDVSEFAMATEGRFMDLFGEGLRAFDGDRGEDVWAYEKLMALISGRSPRHPVIESNVNSGVI